MTESDKVEAAVAAMERGSSLAQVAAVAGVSRQTVANWVREAGLVLRSPLGKCKRHPQHEDALALISEGISDADVAERLGLTVALTESWRRGAGVHHKRGPKGPRAKE